MNNTDLTRMLENLGRSLGPVQELISGFGYLIGIVFIFVALMKLKKIGDFRARSNSSEHMFGVLAYFAMGASLIFLPSMMKVLSNTAFGTSNILQYTQYNPYSVQAAMKTIVQTAGLIWFIRGCVLMAHGSQPGEKNGAKGLTFAAAGVLAVNFDYTVSVVNTSLNYLISATSAVKQASGY